MGIAWLYLTAASVVNGSITVSVTGNHDLSSVETGWSFDIGSARAEILSGTAADDSGNSTLTLARPWVGANMVGQEAQIVPTSGALRAAIVAMNDTNDYAIETHQTLTEIATLDKDITITDPTGEEHTFSSMPKSARLIAEALVSAQNYANDTISELNTQTASTIESMGNSVESAIDTFITGVGGSYYSDIQSGYVTKPEEFIETNTPNTIIDPNTAPIMVDGRLVEVTDQNIVLPNAPFASDTSRTETSLVTTGAVDKGDFVVVGQELGSDGVFLNSGRATGFTFTPGNDSVTIEDDSSSGDAFVRIRFPALSGVKYLVSFKADVESLSSAPDSYYNSLRTTTDSAVVKFSNGGTTDTQVATITPTTDNLDVLFYANDVTVTYGGISVTPYYDTYQAIEDTPTASSLTNTAYFQPIEDGISRQDIAVHRVNKSTLVYDKYTFKGTKKFSAEEMSLKTPVMDYYFGASNSNGLWSDATYWYVPIAAFTRFNAGAYHPWFNEFGTRGLYKVNTHGGWYILPDFITSTYSSITNTLGVNNSVDGLSYYYTGALSIGGSVSRPDSAFYDKVYLNQTLDLRLKAYAESKQDLLNELAQQIESGSYGNGVEGVIGFSFVDENVPTTTLSNIAATSTSKYLSEIFNLGGAGYYKTMDSSEVIKRGVFIDGYPKFPVLISHSAGVSFDLVGASSYYDNWSDWWTTTYGEYTGITNITAIIWNVETNNLFRNIMPHTDLIGDPASYPQSLKDRLASGKSVVGVNPLLVDYEGNSLIPDGTIKSWLGNKKITNGFGHVETNDSIIFTKYTDGPSSGSTIGNGLRITASLPLSRVEFNSYQAKTKSAIESQAGTTLSVLPKAFASNSHSIYKGGNAVYSAIGKVPFGSGSNGYEQKGLDFNSALNFGGDVPTTNENTKSVSIGSSHPDTRILVPLGNTETSIPSGSVIKYIGVQPSATTNPQTDTFPYSAWQVVGWYLIASSHQVLTLNSAVSPASKRFYGLSELDNGLACLDMYSQEMVSNAGVYDGDGAEFTQLTDGILLDDNANTIITSVRSIPLNSFVGSK